MAFAEFKTKSKSSMVTTAIPYLTVDILLNVVVKRSFHYCHWFGICSKW